MTLIPPTTLDVSRAIVALDNAGGARTTLTRMNAWHALPAISPTSSAITTGGEDGRR